jgi:hypothetical protein
MNRTYPRDHRGPGPYHRLQAPGPTIETNPRLPPPLSNIGAILAIAWPASCRPPSRRGKAEGPGRPLGRVRTLPPSLFRGRAREAAGRAGGLTLRHRAASAGQHRRIYQSARDLCEARPDKSTKLLTGNFALEPIDRENHDQEQARAPSKAHEERRPQQADATAQARPPPQKDDTRSSSDPSSWHP